MDYFCIFFSLAHFISCPINNLCKALQLSLLKMVIKKKYGQLLFSERSERIVQNQIEMQMQPPLIIEKQEMKQSRFEKNFEVHPIGKDSQAMDLSKFNIYDDSIYQGSDNENLTPIIVQVKQIKIYFEQNDSKKNQELIANQNEKSDDLLGFVEPDKKMEKGLYNKNYSVEEYISFTNSQNDYYNHVSDEHLEQFIEPNSLLIGDKRKQSGNLKYDEIISFEQKSIKYSAYDDEFDYDSIISNEGGINNVEDSDYFSTNLSIRKADIRRKKVHYIVVNDNTVDSAPKQFIEQRISF